MLCPTENRKFVAEEEKKERTVRSVEQGWNSGLEWKNSPWVHMADGSTRPLPAGTDECVGTHLASSVQALGNSLYNVP